MILRDYQVAGSQYLTDFFSKASRGSRTGLTGPTGCGKSLVEIDAQTKCQTEHDLDIWLVTPRLEIARGILEKSGETRLDSLQRLVEAGWKRKVVTPLRFRNALVKGEIRSVKGIIFDEGHHAPARSLEEIQLLAGMPPCALVTATWYRGSTRSTAKFRAEWGEPEVMITLREAAARGDISPPNWGMLPLVDDDCVEVSSTGEFLVSSASNAYEERLDHLAAECAQRWWDSSRGKWDRPTVAALPSVKCAIGLTKRLADLGAPALCVHEATPWAQRSTYLKACATGQALLSQVSVIGEGVDLPFRRLIDAKPMNSPVAWMQLVGRCMRPVAQGESLPEYWCTNRNLSRHAYLLEGLFPPAAIAECVAAFGGPGKRGGSRALGLESVGRFRACEVKLLDGCICLLYLLTDGRGQYACIQHPAQANPVWAQRVFGSKPDGSRDYGTWHKCKAPEGLNGFASVPPIEPSDKMKNWWDRSAATRGIDPAQKLTRKNFALMPIMFDLGMRFKHE